MRQKSGKLLLLTFFFALFNACGGGGSAIDKKKNELAQKKIELNKLNAEIAFLEKEIAKADPKFQKAGAKGTLVSVVSLAKEDFIHYVEISGKVKTDKDVVVTSEMSGTITRLMVVEGQNVGAGQVVAVQDVSVMQNQVDELKVALELAKILYEKQEALWNQKVGTEIQYIQAKNNKDRLESQLQTIYTQMSHANVKAPIGGIVDELMVKQGQNISPASPMMRIIGLYNVQVVAEVPENYLGKVKIGDMVTVNFPSLNKEIVAPIFKIGATINPDNRTFKIEISIANIDSNLKPDLLATVKIKNYDKAEAVVIPSGLIQKDKTGEYVFIAVEEGESVVARKIKVSRGESYKDKTLILSGLQGNEKLIQDGFRDVTDGTKIQIIS